VLKYEIIEGELSYIGTGCSAATWTWRMEKSGKEDRDESILVIITYRVARFADVNCRNQKVKRKQNLFSF